MSRVEIRGARTHNLAAVDLDLDTDALTVFVGRSGSGKSSLAFDTIHAEGQRRYLEALSTRLRQTIGVLPRPPVDIVAGLPPTVALTQHGDVPPGPVTLGAYAELDVILRVLFGRAGTQHDPATGDVVTATPHDAIVAALLSLPAGSRLTLEAPVRVIEDGAGVLREIVRAGFSRVRVGDAITRVEEVVPASLGPGDVVRIVVDRIRLGDDRRDRVHDAVRTASRAGGGVVVAVVGDEETTWTDRPYSFATHTALPDLSPALFRAPGPHACPTCEGTGARGDAPCPDCGGTGLGPVARAVTFADRTLPWVQACTVGALADEVATWPRDAVSTPLLAELASRLRALVDVGLDHLAVDVPVARLSAGEQQRLRLARQVGSDLSGVLFVLDEPSAGLQRDQVARLVGLLRRLRDQGNGVLVVEHHPDVIAAADRVVEFGPGPGREGGRVVFDGPPAALAGADTPTGVWLGRPLSSERPPRRVDGWLTLRGASERNLVGDAVRVGLGRLTALVGPSGAGKTAVLDALGAHLAARWVADPPTLSGTLDGGPDLTRALVVDDASARRSRRSMPATYTGLWDTLRELLAATHEARVRGLEANAFSLNVVAGRCEACGGLGVRRVDLQFLPSVDVPCEVCDGRRFAGDVLEVRWKGRNAAELLDLTADEALPLLAGHPRLEEGLRALRDVGLGYVALGQPAHTLSGGEARRLRLARELARAARRGAADTVFLLDEPTAGLHPQDVAVLAALLHRLVDEGATVVVATHHAQLAAACDHVVVLGPGVGRAGGRVVAEGAPDDVLDQVASRVEP
ncbi:MAG: ABC-ATPase UvrA [Alphaproteobacteria bacterium]|nr:ABC-ATPase UvrA [Alphaproteobacteria bacterium]